MTVYRFKVWDTQHDKYVCPDHKQTAEGIKALGGIIIEGTAEEVSDAAIDEQWRYLPKKEEGD